MLLYTAHDGTAPTSMARTHLVEPCLEEMQRDWKQERSALGIHLLTQCGANLDPFLREAGASRSGVMLSAAHGIGRPEEGWASPEDQRALQGSLLLGPDELLTRARPGDSVPAGRHLAQRRVLRGGDPRGRASSSRGCRRWLARASRRPTPRARWTASRTRVISRSWPRSLRPCSRIHVDPWRSSPTATWPGSSPSWTWTVHRATALAHSLALGVLADGSRVGVALDTLLGFYREVNDLLTQDYPDTEEAPEPSPAQRVRQASVDDAQ